MRTSCFGQMCHLNASKRGATLAITVLLDCHFVHLSDLSGIYAHISSMLCLKQVTKNCQIIACCDPRHVYIYISDINELKNQ